VNLQKSSRLIRIEQRFKSSVDSDDLRWFTRDMGHKGIRAGRFVPNREFLDRKDDFLFQILARPPLGEATRCCLRRRMGCKSPAKGTFLADISRAQDFL
jgi:hypothetical protein